MQPSLAKDWADLFGAMASLAWPLLALFIVIKFAPSLTALLKRDDVSIEVGGFKLSSQEAIGKIGQSLSDLQNKIIDIEARIPSAKGDATPTREVSKQISEMSRVVSILWVDDNPENNAFIIASLDPNIYSVSLAKSTSEALRRLEVMKFEIVISDMGRQEDGADNETAGLDLLRALKLRALSSRKALFTTHQSVHKYGDEARKLGADLVTSSPTDIVAFIVKR